MTRHRLRPHLHLHPDTSRTETIRDGEVEALVIVVATWRIVVAAFDQWEI